MRCCASVISGPKSTPGSSRPTASTTRAATASWAGASTSRRVVAEHTWPLLTLTADTAAATARSRSASANTTSGDLPPSSSVSGTRRSAASAARWRPVATDPVNAIFRTSGWAASGVPTSGPAPVTTFSTPSGNPASAARRARSRVEVEVSSDGFATTAFPTASAGASARQAWLSGRFQGVMTATTP